MFKTASRSRVDAASRLLVQASSTLANMQLSPKYALKLTAEMAKGVLSPFPNDYHQALHSAYVDTTRTHRIPRPFVGTPEATDSHNTTEHSSYLQWSFNGSVQDVLLTVVENKSLCPIVADVSGRTFGGAQHHVYLVDDTRIWSLIVNKVASATKNLLLQQPGTGLGLALRRKFLSVMAANLV